MRTSPLNLGVSKSMPRISYATLAAGALVRWPELDPRRMESAVGLALRGWIVLARIDESGQEIAPSVDAYAVKSSKCGASTWYVVRPGKRSCTCPDSKYRGIVCKHRLAVWLYCELPKRTSEAYDKVRAMRYLSSQAASI